MKKVWFKNPLFPKCFDSREQFKGWHHALLQSKAALYNCWVCADCTPTFQKEMIAQKRCENPHVKFKKEYEDKTTGPAREDEWFIVGYVDEEDYKKEVERRRVSKIFWG